MLVVLESVHHKRIITKLLKNILFLRNHLNSQLSEISITSVIEPS